MKEKRFIKEHLEEIDYLSSSASTTDCTGLIPSLPQTEAELEAYEEMYRYIAEAEE